MDARFGFCNKNEELFEWSLGRVGRPTCTEDEEMGMEADLGHSKHFWADTPA